MATRRCLFVSTEYTNVTDRWTDTAWRHWPRGKKSYALSKRNISDVSFKSPTNPPENTLPEQPPLNGNLTPTSIIPVFSGKFLSGRVCLGREDAQIPLRSADSYVEKRLVETAIPVMWCGLTEAWFITEATTLSAKDYCEDSQWLQRFIEGRVRPAENTTRYGTRAAALGKYTGVTPQYMHWDVSNIYQTSNPHPGGGQQHPARTGFSSILAHTEAAECFALGLIITDTSQSCKPSQHQTAVTDLQYT